MSSLRIQNTVKDLPETGFNIAKSMLKNGYSKQGSRSGTNYANIRKEIEKYYEPGMIKAKIVKAEQKFIKDNDNSNYARMLELQAKITGLLKDKDVTQVAVFQGFKQEIEGLDKRIQEKENSVDITTSNSNV